MLRLNRNTLRFRLERLLVRGALPRLLAIACAIGLLALVAGTAALALDGERFHGLGESVWWAFLRITDTGYLGDDHGVGLRLVSAGLTLLGVVLFMGSLVAIMVQWLDATVRRLELGLSPVPVSRHVLLLGWTNRTPIIVREMLLSGGRMRRFLELHHVHRLTLVILAQEPGAQLRAELRAALGPLWREKQIIFRNGSALRGDDLERVGFDRASAIVAPGTDFAAPGPGRMVPADTDPADTDLADAATLKVLLSLNRHVREHGDRPPYLSTEITDVRRAAVIRGAYCGPVEVVASDAILCLLLAQNVRHAGLSLVYRELLTSDGESTIYVRACPELAGLRLADLDAAFDHAVVLGLLVARSADTAEQGGNAGQGKQEDRGNKGDGTGAPRRYRPVFDPASDVRLGMRDKVVFVAARWQHTHPDRVPAAAAAAARPQQALGTAPQVSQAPQTSQVPQAAPTAVAPRRVLLMGWNDRIPLLLEEFERVADERFEVDVLSTFAAAEREARVARYGQPLHRVAVRHLEGDYAVPGELAALDLGGYACVVVMGCDWLPGKEEADARSILGHRVLRACLAGHAARGAARPRVILELLDPESAPLLRLEPGEELYVSPSILGYIQAHVALRPELNTVLHELFCAGRPDAVFRAAREYGLDGRAVNFAEIRAAARALGDTALGVRPLSGPDAPPNAKQDAHQDAGRNAKNGLCVNPPRDQRWALGPEDEILVLSGRD